MKNCSVREFNQLVDEILNGFIDQAGPFLKEKKALTETDLKVEFEASEQQLLIKLMVEYSHMPLLDGMYSVQDLLNLLNLISVEIAGLNNYRQQQINERYSEILNRYIDLVLDESGSIYVYNQGLRRRINGILNVRKRYALLLNKKLEIFYSELRAYVQRNGKFKNASQAVQLILPTLQIKFREFDLQWVRNKVAENQKRIEELIDTRTVNETRGEDSLGSFITVQDRTFLNQIGELQNENKKWEQFLVNPDKHFPQQKKLPFNTAYCDEVLLNHLRRRSDLIKEIIQISPLT
ncbi:hypothetical protein [Acinetobacter zhairhuonensis]|uniref:hypothetical protein n=1 Tax=Acinetobacter sp. A7.4 TaxID=2919921 RepID=UPI001F4F5A7A|nr:hypothetical protein [Acinetobacter sp. A7.4]MCJ8161976.1 hypothetical protein [Acinetobacter sp. A7.4]